jgi:hypothetical protein
VEILDPVEQLGLAIFEPLGARERLALGAGAMATTVVGDALMAAAVALLDMATEGGGGVGWGRGNKSNGLVVAHTVVVATFK